MAISNTSFEERIARIQDRAARGEAHGTVTPGVHTPDAPDTTARRGGYAMALIGTVLVMTLIALSGVALTMTGIGGETVMALAAHYLHGM